MQATQRRRNYRNPATRDVVVETTVGIIRVTEQVLVVTRVVINDQVADVVIQQNESLLRTLIALL